jgi:hypothetical protein
VVRLVQSKSPRCLVIWRGPAGAMVRPLSTLSAAFLQALNGGADAPAAIESALEVSADACALDQINTEILQASFARLITRPVQEKAL